MVVKFITDFNFYFLFLDSIGCATPETCMEACGEAAGCTNYAYAKLVLFLMPSGLRGDK